MDDFVQMKYQDLEINQRGNIYSEEFPDKNLEE